MLCSRLWISLLDRLSGTSCALRIEEGTCDVLISTGSSSCEHDFCTDCEGSTNSSEGVGTGGHQAGLCDLDGTACSDEPVYYPRESLPDYYLWETPFSSEMLADSVVLLSNFVGAVAIVVASKHPILREPMSQEAKNAMAFVPPAQVRLPARPASAASATPR
jgi:hypothetical protein